MRAWSRCLKWSCFAALATALIACGGDEDEEGELPTVDCSKVTVPTYAQLSILPACTNCHASTLTGSARGGAPTSVNFDTYAAAKAEAMEGAREVHAGRMPYPNGEGVSDAQREEFYAWALCGTPQ